MAALVNRRKKKLKPGRIIIACILIVVAFGILISSRSFIKIHQLSRIKKKEIQARDSALDEKRKLLMELYRLEKDSTYMEEIARKEYGMIKKGWEVFLISSPDTSGIKKNGK
ncbi:MAG: septum formation initiator family protein [Candidatus Latescibacter sp.]|nr:septum formation initiator family protein [Candidatus Latescibacter sp.]